MNASRLCFAALLAMTAASGGAALADQSALHGIADFNDQALQLARQARWTVADRFTGSQDFAGLRKDSRDMSDALRDIEDALFSGRSPQLLQSLVEDARDVLIRFEEHANHSEFARVAWNGNTRIRPTGYTHLMELQATLRRLHDDVDNMTILLQPTAAQSDIEVVPDPAYRFDPRAPMTCPPTPDRDVPHWNGASDVFLPPVRTRSGDATLRVLLH